MMRSEKWFVALFVLVLGTLCTQPAHAQTTNKYTVEAQWGDETAPWREDGTWVIGGRAKQSVVALNVKSSDDGKTLAGTMTYEGEGPIRFKGTATGNNEYTVKAQWGDETAPWREDGTWVIGGRAKQSVVALNVKSSDDGKTLAGTMIYKGEGLIRFKGTLSTKQKGNADQLLADGNYEFYNKAGNVNLYVTLKKVGMSKENGVYELTDNNGYMGAESSEDGAKVGPAPKATLWVLVNNGDNAWNFLHSKNQANAVSYTEAKGWRLRRNNAGGKGNADQIFVAKKRAAE